MKFQGIERIRCLVERVSLQLANEVLARGSGCGGRREVANGGRRSPATEAVNLRNQRVELAFGSRCRRLRLAIGQDSGRLETNIRNETFGNGKCQHPRRVRLEVKVAATRE